MTGSSVSSGDSAASTWGGLIGDGAAGEACVAGAGGAAGTIGAAGAVATAGGGAGFCTGAAVGAGAGGAGGATATCVCGWIGTALAGAGAPLVSSAVLLGRPAVPGTNEKSSASDDEIHGTCSLREARVTPTRV